jgi:hypothetical protein
MLFAAKSAARMTQETRSPKRTRAAMHLFGLRALRCLRHADFVLSDA